MSLPEPGPIARRAVEEFELNEGVTEEGTSNWGKYIRLYLAAVGLYNPAPWCGAVAVFRLLDAAADLKLKVPDDFPRSGYTPTLAQWGKRNGLWIPAGPEAATKGRRGDLCFFYFSSMRRIAHVGMVTSVHSWGVFSVEGNTSKPGAGGSQRDGGGIWKKRRTFESLGSRGGLVRLPW